LLSLKFIRARWGQGSTVAATSKEVHWNARGHGFLCRRHVW
jgi:hypothetical protein